MVLNPIHFNPYHKGKIMAQTKKANAVESTIDYVALAFDAGVARGEYQNVTVEQAERKETIDNVVATLQKAKVKVGRYSAKGTGCAVATSFADGLLSAGLAKGTVANYVSEFRTVVNAGSGKMDLNSSRTKAKGKTSDSAPADDDDKLVSKVNTLYKAAGFTKFCEAVQRAYDDDRGDFFECIHDWLSQHGVKFKEETEAK